jgi:pentatricopeptide repeat protein
MYAKCGFLVEAQQAFNKLQVKDVVTWNTLIAGYSDQEQGEEAIKRFDQMRMEGVSPDSATLLGGLKACCLLGTLHRGSEMHSEIVKRGLLKEDSNLGNALVDMYAKCGSVAASRDVFDKLQARDLVSWNSLIGGYAHSGESEKVFEIFQCMLAGGIKPGMITYILVLNACSRNGLIRRSCTFFEGMSRNHGMVPVVEHFACIVDLLGRVGQLCEAASTIRNSSYCASLVPWIALLGACRKWGNAKLGKEAFKHVAALRSNGSYNLNCVKSAAIMGNV